MLTATGIVSAASVRNALDDSSALPFAYGFLLYVSRYAALSRSPTRTPVQRLGALQLREHRCDASGQARALVRWAQYPLAATLIGRTAVVALATRSEC